MADVYDRRVYDPTQRPPLTPAIALARINRYLTRWVYRTLQTIVGTDIRQLNPVFRDHTRQIASNNPRQWARYYANDYMNTHWSASERYRMRMGYSSRWGQATSRSRLPEYRKSRI
jgi:hypothetical protein